MSDREFVKLPDGRVVDLFAPWDGEFVNGVFVKTSRPITGEMLWESKPLSSNDLAKSGIKS